MDEIRFDALTRFLSLPGSRRRALGGLLAGALGPALGVFSADRAGAAKQKKKRCPPCKKRKQGKCRGSKPDGAVCAGGACQRGRCRATAAPPPDPRSVPPDPHAVPPPAVLLAAGDIASCSSKGDEATAALLDTRAGTVAALGDTVYDAGSAEEFSQCYEPSWGRHKARTRPAVGNHEYGTPGAAGYFGYFGAAAGDPTTGYYSYELGSWHIVVLNSNCSQVGGCDVGSPQEQWLRADLAAHPSTCTLAYWHHPRFSSDSTTGGNGFMQPIWQAFSDLGGDVVLTGHAHNYERFAPLNANGTRDDARGIRQFVVGTGGVNLGGFSTPLPTSEVRNHDTFGILQLTLHPTGFDWQFVPVAGKSFTDVGSGVCH